MKIARPKPSVGVSVYLWEIFRGMGVTLRHALSHLIGGKPMMTLHYPEVKRPMPRGYRGKHRLTERPDGQAKCVACMLCATACPARCIHIEAGEHPDPAIEKYPVSFEIDLLECVFCGMCVEACPCDAIRMDSGQYSIVGTKREDFIIHKEQLLSVEPQFEDERKPRTPESRP